MEIKHINPEDSYNSVNTRGYTQVVTAASFSKLIAISGQLPLDKDNKLIGEGDIEAQARACYENLRRALKAAGADLGNVIRMTTYVTDLASQAKGIRKVRAEYFGTTTPPASTMIQVPTFVGNVLIEVEALAVI